MYADGMWWRIVLAADELPPGLGGLVQYGALGIMASLGMWGFFRAWRRECERSDALAEDNRKLNAAIQDRIVPVVQSAIGAIEESTEMMREQQRYARWGREGARDREGG
jgi:hypothetical protein